MTTKRGTAAEILKELMDEQAQSATQRKMREAEADEALRLVWDRASERAKQRASQTSCDETLNDLAKRFKIAPLSARREQEIDRAVAEFLNKRSEPEITLEIKNALLRLRDLYLERRGALIAEDPNGDHAWCAVCGMEPVNLVKETATCQDCRTG